MKIPRLCIYCKYFVLEPGCPDYGEDFLMECLNKNFEEYNGYYFTMDDFRKIIETAENCEDFKKVEIVKIKP